MPPYLRSRGNSAHRRLLQQREGAHDVGLDEFAGAVDRPVDMAFRREIHDEVRLMPVEQRTKGGRVADIDLGKGVTRVSRRLRDRSEVCRIGELVDIDDIGAGAIEQMPDHGRPDEAGASSHEDGLACEAHVVAPCG
jgi:hypothetical protein